LPILFPVLYNFSNEAGVFIFIIGLKLVSRFFSLCCIELGSFGFSFFFSFHFLFFKGEIFNVKQPTLKDFDICFNTVL